MASLRTSFEKEVRHKLLQKSNAHQTEEAILLKAFKYFDLNNSGGVDREEFIKVVEKIGIQVFNKSDFYSLFEFYDTDKGGFLDYKEFTGILFGNQSIGKKTMSPNSKIPYGKGGVENVDDLIEKFKKRLKDRGGNGILSLGRQFRIFDDDESKSLDMNEFRKAIHDFQVDINENEVQTLFEYFDRARDGTINYDEFLLGVRGPINSFRRRLVNQAFDKLDKDGSGIVTGEDLIGVYNAQFHPDVRAGKKTEKQIFNEFLNTFENYSALRGIRDGQVTREEFEDYYTFISSSIDNDQYFELMMNNAWRMNDGANKRWNDKGWSNTGNSGSKDKSLQNNYNQTHKNNKETSPFQKNNKRTPVKGTPNNRMQSNNSENSLIAGIQKIRTKLQSRGCKGFLGIQRQFKIMDDDNDKAINPQEFQKAMRDYKINLTPSEEKAIFNEFDMDGNGTLGIDEIVRAIRGEMNQLRVNLVARAFKKMDRSGDGVLQVNDIKGVYNARMHPDVKSGKRTEDEILGEFLETFEAHHNLKTGFRDQTVTMEEFIEYYNNVSANIDNDEYFELMICNTYKLDTQNYKAYTSNKAAWKGDYSNQFKSDNQNDNRNRPITPENNNHRREKAKKAGYNPNAHNNQQQHPQQNQNVSAQKISELVSLFRKKIQNRGVRGMFSMQRSFKIIDDDESLQLSLNEFTKALHDFRVEIPENEISLLFGAFDMDDSGSIDINEFLRIIRGPMSDSRKKLVEMAFKKLDKNRNGIVTLDDVRGVYSAKNHPEVRAGKKTEDEILGEFLDTFEIHHATLTGDIKMRDKTVTLEEFYEYYNNISSSIDDDRYFELMIRSAWKIF